MMNLIKNNSKNLILFLLKTLLLIVALDIFITSCFQIIKLEFKNNNLESKFYLDIKKLNYDYKF